MSGDDDSRTSLDDAVAAALRNAQPGDVVIVHDMRCPVRADDSARCRCRPLRVEVSRYRA